jgi:hypothetical protein
MTTPYELTFNDETIADLIVDTMDNHHDMDVSFADHARHIVAALRDNGLLADAALDVEGVRHVLDELSVLGREVLGDDFSFVTAGIWSHKSRGPDGFVVTIHTAGPGMSPRFAAPEPGAAFAAARDWIMAHDPAQLEAEGWQILGVVRA